MSPFCELRTVFLSFVTPMLMSMILFVRLSRIYPLYCCVVCKALHNTTKQSKSSNNDHLLSDYSFLILKFFKKLEDESPTSPRAQCRSTWSLFYKGTLWYKQWAVVPWEASAGIDGVALNELPGMKTNFVVITVHSCFASAWFSLW